MDTSRKEAVQRGTVHLQQRFYICTENGKVVSVLLIVCFQLLHSAPLHLPLTAGIDAAAGRRVLSVGFSICCTYTCNCSTGKKIKIICSSC